MALDTFAKCEYVRHFSFPCTGVAHDPIVLRSRKPHPLRLPNCVLPEMAVWITKQAPVSEIKSAPWRRLEQPVISISQVRRILHQDTP